MFHELHSGSRGFSHNHFVTPRLVQYVVPSVRHPLPESAASSVVWEVASQMIKVFSGLFCVALDLTSWLCSSRVPRLTACTEAGLSDSHLLTLSEFLPLVRRRKTKHPGTGLVAQEVKPPPEMPVSRVHSSARTGAHT